MTRSMLNFAFCFAYALMGSLSLAEESSQTLQVAVVQMKLERTLQDNASKIVRLTADAARSGARLVVFPEGSLAAPDAVPPEEVPAALQQVANAARQNSVYIIVVARFLPAGRTRDHNQLHLFGPDGDELLVYDKDSFAKDPGNPRLISIDGVPCSVIICSDRWSRPVESLPPILGAKVIIECSNNYDTEWIPDLQWYWYVPRAIRNTAFVLFANTARETNFPDGHRGHGHSAVIAPDGSIIAASDDESDVIITAELDLRQATRQMAIRRSEHPLFQEWWELGQAIQRGASEPQISTPPLVSADNSVKCGFSQMSCTSSMEKNLETIQSHIKLAAADGLDLVVFPELALTGDQASDLERLDVKELQTALESIQQSAKENRLTVVVGAPSYAGDQRYNSAYAIGPDGNILTRYDQIVVNSPNVFQGGLSTKDMWFQVNGVWSILTIGDDIIWNEMAELAALKGARLHCHLENNRNLSPAEALLREQQVAVFASNRLLTIVANPIFPELMTDPDACFSLGSGIWDDLTDGDWCAVKVNVGRPWEGVFSSSRVIPGSSNPELKSGYWRKGSRYRSWMMFGAAAMFQDDVNPDTANVQRNEVPDPQ